MPLPAASAGNPGYGAEDVGVRWVGVVCGGRRGVDGAGCRGSETSATYAGGGEGR